MPFHFTVFDDPDNTTVEDSAIVYGFLADLGLRTTLGVWPLRGPGNPGIRIDGATLEDPDYLQHVLELRARGFELALHGVQNGSADRRRIEQGFGVYHDRLGAYPRVHTNHSRNRDCLYWGADRFATPLNRIIVGRGADRGLRFEGHVADSPHFWGDLCRQHITYVRNLVFNEINLDRINPSLPYRDPRTPYVNYWFSSTEGADVARFCRAISEEQQDRLEEQQGVCIMYTHFASGFVERGKLNARFEKLMRRLAQKPGVFIPVGELLDKLRAQRGGGVIPALELALMEQRWLREKLVKGRT